MSRINDEEMLEMAAYLDAIGERIYKGSTNEGDVIQLLSVSKNLLFEIYMNKVEGRFDDG